MARRVVVTGLGVISSIGNDKKKFWQNLKLGKSAISPLHASITKTNIVIGARVVGFDPRIHFSAQDLAFLDPVSQFATIAAREAALDAGLTCRDSDLSSAAAIIGTGCGGKHTDEETYVSLYQQGRSRAHPLTIPRGMPSAAASAVSRDLGIKGPVFSVASACASGAHAIIQGYLFLKAGLVDIAVVGGADAPFTYGLLKAWDALRVVSKDTCRPFSKDRSGMVLGEGAGVVILESQQHAEARGARAYAEVAGCGMTSDAGHITRPDFEGITSAIRQALVDAKVELDSVDYVNAHGTGTITNDITETRALHDVFGPHAKALAVSSTKSMHGHALGASSALEFIASVLAVHEDVAPPTANFTEAGEGCDLDYVPIDARKMRIDVAMTNAFAFGGLNAVAVIRST